MSKTAEHAREIASRFSSTRRVSPAAANPAGDLDLDALERMDVITMLEETCSIEIDDASAALVLTVDNAATCVEAALTDRLPVKER